MSFNKPSMNGLNNFSIQEVNEDIANNTSAISTNTSNIATNASNIATNTSAISTNTSNIATNTSNIATNTSNIATNTSNITANTITISGFTDAISSNQGSIATNTSNIATNTSNIATNTSAIATNTSNIATNTSNIATNTSAIATNTSNIATNTSAIATNTSNIATNASNIATNTSDITTNASNIATNTSAISNKQNTLTAGTNITINNDTISASGGTFTASSNGGLNLTGTEFSLDFSNTNSTIEIPQEVHIEKDGQPQLLVEPASTTGQDATIEIRGARNGSNSSQQSRLKFSNYDNDLTSTNILGSIHGRVSNATSNTGGLMFDSYADGSTRTGAMSISSNGNVWVGGGSSFQDFNKFQVTGNSYVNGTATANTLKTNGTGSGNTTLEIEDGIVLFEGGTGNGTTGGNGVLQIQCRNSGKLKEGICMRANDNNNNCINFRNTSDSARGRIDGNGSSRVVYRTSSDVRLKENIEDLDTCWELMKEIRPRKFRWIEDQIDDAGFIAQEIYSISGLDAIKPKAGKYECCDNSLNTFDDDGYCEYPMESEDKIYPHMLGYADFIPYLTKALKECIERIEVLENEINELKNV